MRLPAAHPLQLVAGLAVWTVWFAGVYGGMSLGCSLAPPDPAAGAANPLSLGLLLASAATAAGLVAAGWRCARAAPREAAPPRRFVAAVSAALYAVAAVSVVVVALPLLALPPCV